MSTTVKADWAAPGLTDADLGACVANGILRRDRAELTGRVTAAGLWRAGHSRKIAIGAGLARSRPLGWRREQVSRPFVELTEGSCSTGPLSSEHHLRRVVDRSRAARAGRPSAPA